jgi:hypothetical protein
VTYCVAFSGAASGWCGVRIKNAAGNNYGNRRVNFVAGDATTNPQYFTSWLEIKTDVSVAPDSIAIGDYVEFYPAQTSGYDAVAGADLASSWVMIEFTNNID